MAALNQARAQAVAARHAVVVAVSSAHVAAQSNGRQVALRKAALDIAQTTYDKTILGYRNGLFTITDVLAAQAALASSRSDYTLSIYDAALSQRQLLILTGNDAEDK